MTVYNAEDGINLLSTASDYDGDTLSVTKINGTTQAFPYTFAVGDVTVTVSADGAVTISDGGVTTGNPEAGGIAEYGSFTYTIDDGFGGEVTKTATITGIGGALSVVVAGDVTVRFDVSGAGSSGTYPAIGPTDCLANFTGGAPLTVSDVNGAAPDFQPYHQVSLSGGGFARVYPAGGIAFFDGGATGYFPGSGELSIGTLTVKARAPDGGESASAGTVTVLLVKTVTQVAPSITTAPALSPASGAVGATFTASSGTYAGTPTPAVTGELTFNGAIVGGIGGEHTSAATGTVVYTETATNTAGTVTATATATVTASSGTAVNQTAEWGADTPATKGGFRPVNSAGVAEAVTSATAVSGMGAYTPSVSGGRLVFNATGAPNGGVVDVVSAAGTTRVGITTTAGCTTCTTIAEANAAAVAYGAATKTIALRAGAYDPGGNLLAGINTGVTAISVSGGPSAAAHTITQNGPEITFRPATGEVCVFGPIFTAGAKGFRVQGFNLRAAETIEQIHYEPENPATISAIVTGATTQITLVERGFKFAQIKVGDRLILCNVTGASPSLHTGPWAAVVNTPYDVTAVDNATKTATINLNSTGFAAWGGTGALRGYFTGRGATANVGATPGAGGVLAIGIFDNCNADNLTLQPLFGKCPDFFEGGAWDHLVFLNCSGHGFRNQYKGLGGGYRVDIIGGMMTGSYADVYALRSNNFIDQAFPKFAQVAVTGATKTTGIVEVTCTAHGLIDGDAVAIRGVAGMTQLNGNWFVVPAYAAWDAAKAYTPGDRVTISGVAYVCTQGTTPAPGVPGSNINHNPVGDTSAVWWRRASNARTANTFCIAQIVGLNDANGVRIGNKISPVDGTAWGTYTSGGLATIRPVPHVYIRDTAPQHANDITKKALHTDFFQGSSGLNNNHATYDVGYNAANLHVDAGTATQGVLGKGGADDDTLCEGHIHNTLLCCTAENVLIVGLSRPGKTLYTNVTVVVDNDTAPTIIGTMNTGNGDATVAGVMVGKLSVGATYTGPAPLLCPPKGKSGATYATVMTGAFTAGADGCYRTPNIKTATGTKAARLATLVAECNFRPAYAANGFWNTTGFFG